MTDVLLVGLGNIGSRHLQGLARAETPLCIRLAEPSDATRAVAMGRWQEAGGEETAHVILDADLPRYDIAIVATPASVRRQVVEQLASRADVGAWILEKPIAQRIADIDAVETAVGARAWINTPRRLIAWHQQMAAAIQAAGTPLEVTIEGGAWGLACNALHFVDLVRWWSGSEPVSVDTAGLDAQWHASKRPGYAEIFGTLRIDFSDGTRLALTSREDGEAHRIMVRAPGGTWTIVEREGSCIAGDGTRSDGAMTPVSEVTGALIDTLVVTGSVELPRLAPIAAAERLLLAALIPHRHASGGSADRLDIT